MSDGLIKRLRDIGEEETGYGIRNEAADLIEQQAAEIVNLKHDIERHIANHAADLNAVAPAVDAQPVAIQAGDDVTVTNVPARIYLNLGDLYEMGEIPFQSLTDVTWCEDRIDDADIEYVRADASAQSEGLRMRRGIDG